MSTVKSDTPREVIQEVHAMPSGLVSDEVREKAKAAVREALKGSKTAPKQPKDPERGNADAEPQADDEDDSEADVEPAKPKAKKAPKEPANDETDTPEPKVAKAKESNDSEEDEDEEDSEEPESDSAKLSRLQKERAKAKKLRKDAEESVAALKREMDTERERLTAEREALRAERDELAKTVAKVKILKRDPLRAMKELEVDPEDLLKRIADDGTPESEYRRYVDRLEEQVEELRSWKDSFEKKSKDYEENVVQRREEERRATIINDYLAEASKKDLYPNFIALYGKDQRYQVTLGHEAANELTAELGRTPTRPEILKRLERDAKATVAERFGSALTGNTPQVDSDDDADVYVAPKRLPTTLGKSELNDRPGISVPDDLEERRRLAKRAVKTIVRRASQEASED